MAIEHAIWKVGSKPERPRSAMLGCELLESYARVLFRVKCDNVFHLMLDYASHHRKWAA